MLPQKKLSIIVPAFNEEKNIPEIARRLEPIQTALLERGVDMELILVDDHSTDSTPAVARRLVAANRHVGYFRLSRNCGSHIACAAGLDHCTGDAAIIMAADLQDPPEVILEMAAAWSQGNDVVWAVRSAREGEAWTTLLSSWLFNSMMRSAFRDLPRKGADFVLLSRRVIDAYNAMHEKNTNVNLAIRWIGFRQTSFEYVKKARFAGRSGFSLGKKIKVFVDSVVSYSYAPLRLISILGLGLIATALICAVAAVVGRFFGLFASGLWIVLALILLLAGQGAILTALGILGEYTWRALDEVRGRPRYIIEESSTPGQRPEPAGEPVFDGYRVGESRIDEARGAVS
jgi:dolichol-phosphate mannosyltransferase